MDFPGIDGILGTRASLMLDALFLSMFGLVLILGWSVYEVKYRHRFELHKRVQIALAVILLVAVTLFEIDIRLHGWEDRAAGKMGGEPAAIVWIALYAHLVFAISTAILWPFTIIFALRKFPSPPAPGAHSPTHIRLGRLAAFDLLLTSITGWIFYWMAFVR